MLRKRMRKGQKERQLAHKTKLAVTLSKLRGAVATSVSLTPTAGLSENSESLALCIYINHILPHRPGCLIEEYRTMFNSSGRSTLFAKAMMAVALNNLAFDRRYAYCKTLAYNKYYECVELVRLTIKDPAKLPWNSFIMALRLLDTFEVRLPICGLKWL